MHDSPISGPNLHSLPGATYFYLSNYTYCQLPHFMVHLTNNILYNFHAINLFNCAL
jgi:hypothetical protein